MRGLQRISGSPREIAVRLRREVLERVGLPITVGVARTKFLAKVASGVAKPDGLLVVPPDGELAFLHPLPVERLWGVGAVTAGKLHARGITTVGEVAGMAEEALDRAARARASGRHLHALAHNRDPRPVQVGRRRRLDRRAARARPQAEDRRPTLDAVVVGLVDRVDAPAAQGPARLSHRHRCGCASTTSPARPARTRCSRRPTETPVILATVRGLLATAMPMIEAQGCTLVGFSLSNLQDNTAVQLALEIDRRRARALDAVMDEVRRRYGSDAITRAVLLGRDQGFTMPMLPD